MSWLSFFIGVVVGGVIVYFFWRRKSQEAIESERALRQRLADAERETRHLTSQLDGVKQQEEQLATCQAEVQRKTEELQRVTEQLSAAEGHLSTLREQLAAAETTTETAMDRTPPEAVEEMVSSGQPDDLSRIEGIGPKVAQVLNESGILTFAQLAQTDVNRLQAILQEAGPRFKLIAPESWPEQAGLAAKGEWDLLKKLQDELDGGKYQR
jgi:predicted flap endonuclease-1-like 5' DNA nuclease